MTKEHTEHLIKKAIEELRDLCPEEWEVEVDYEYNTQFQRWEIVVLSKNYMSSMTYITHQASSDLFFAKELLKAFPPKMHRVLSEYYD